MRNKILVIISLISFSVCSAQFNPFSPAKAILKSGDTLDNILGKLKSNTFKYKIHSKAKSKQIDFSQIKSVQLSSANNDTKTIYFFRIKGENEFIPVQEILRGKHLEVYGVTYSYTITGAGGIRMTGTGVNHYVKKPYEDELTLIGHYDAIIGEFKRRVYNYFSDCELLLKKLNEKELRLRNGLNEIAKFYNENCGEK